MSLVRLATFTLTASLLPFAACGGSSGDDTLPPAEGEHTQYVADTITVPDSVAASRELGLDLDGDGNVDNQLGMVLSTLGSMGIDTQSGLTQSLDQGTIIILGDVQTTAFTSAAASGFSIYIGDNPTPAACVDANDMVCRLHLDGNGSFDIKAGTATDGQVLGPFVNGTFKGGPGTLGLQIALTAGQPIDVNLIGARAQLKQVTATDIGDAILAGAVTKTDIDTQILPAVQTQIEPLITRDCTPNGTDCGCTASSTGATVLDLFDTDMSCDISLEELQTNSLITTLLAPDVDIDGDGVNESVSLGVGATFVGATYTLPTP